MDMTKKSVLIDAEKHRKLKLYSVKNNISIKALIEEYIEAISKGMRTKDPAQTITLGAEEPTGGNV
jgi:hypothetical protein